MFRRQVVNSGKSLAGVNRPKQRRRSAGSAASVGGEMGRYVRGMQVIDSKHCLLSMTCNLTAIEVQLFAKQSRLVRSQIASFSSRRCLGIETKCAVL